MAGPWTKMVDLAYTEEEQLETAMPMPANLGSAPTYPYGLRISLDEGSLEKLGLDDDPDVGDYIDLRAFGCVTSASREKRSDGKVSRRVEIQIERLAVEDEDREEMGGGEDERTE